MPSISLFKKKLNYQQQDQNVTSTTVVDGNRNQQGNSVSLDEEQEYPPSDHHFVIEEDNDGKKDETLSPRTRMIPGEKIPKNAIKALFHQLLSVLFMMVIQIGIPLGLYYGLRNKIGIVYALVISGIPSLLWVIVKFIMNRKIDILGCIIALGFILSGIISIVSGDERAALIRDSAVGAIVGFLFLITLIPLKTKWFVLRPLTYVVGENMFPNLDYEWVDRDGHSQQQHILDWQYEHIRFFRWSMRIQTFGWGILLILELIACLLFVEVSDMSTDDIVKYNNIINAVVISFMVTVGIIASWYLDKKEKIIGKQWTKENDFTDKFERQKRQQQEQEVEATDTINNNATTD
ncbi:hypothetical protein BDA99DRAFT_565729 [Phascolomyces articulosus]|uniref:Uncharacterized protein n=1 Tax=Phascolomyces articulosus TaxID=60185 RepID=A0AAD5JN75_9FUNG|nr:hypothetical protein BDA99DRAFT_565729 [Phascolomyces articulosus]